MAHVLCPRADYDQQSRRADASSHEWHWGGEAGTQGAIQGWLNRAPAGLSVWFAMHTHAGLTGAADSVTHVGQCATIEATMSQNSSGASSIMAWPTSGCSIYDVAALRTKFGTPPSVGGLLTGDEVAW